MISHQAPRCRALTFTSLLWLVWHQDLLLTQALQQVQVCRNKHCCKGAPYLLESLVDLVGNDRVEETGCLSQCERGPNVQLDNIIPGEPPIILHGIQDAGMAAIQIELATGEELPKLLKAAAKVLERVAQTQDASERERLTTSVIGKLSMAHLESSAISHAYSLRAMAFADQEKWEEAIEDAQRVVLSEHREGATESCVSKCYRIWADAEGQLNHKDQAVLVLQDWQRAQPAFRTKLQQEVKDMLKP